MKKDCGNTVYLQNRTNSLFRFWMIHIYVDGGIKAWGNADPRVSTTSVSCVPLKRSKQLPNVTHGDGRPAQAVDVS